MENIILRELGNGLVLRRATAADTQALVAFNEHIHGTLERGEPDRRVGAWTRDLLERPHPTFNAGDFTIVEDVVTGKIVSSLNLIPQTWTYGGIPFGMGRTELVGTLPEYRHQGLVRAQFDVVHQWSAERGHKLQAITGIPYYYRQFGYEMGLSLGGGRAGFVANIPVLKDGESEPYHIRPAMEDDIGFISQLYQRANQRYLVSCVRDETLWRYEISGSSPENINRMELRVIESPDGEPVGYLAHPTFTVRGMLAAHAYEIKPGISWGAVTPSVVRYLVATGKTYPPESGSDEWSSFGFWLGTQHPVYEVIPERLPRKRNAYAWYVRVSDLPDFLRHVAPVLERRLAQSLLVGHTGELKITFYQDGIKLVLEQGHLAGIEPWKPTPQGHSGEAGFPERTFLRLLFGYNSIRELMLAFADCWTESGEVQVLLNILFPKQVSNIWPVA